MAFPVRWTSFPASPPFSASAAKALSSAPGARTPSGRSTMKVPPKSPRLCSLPSSLPPGPAVAGIRLSLPGGAARGRSTFSPRSRAPRPPSRLPAPRSPPRALPGSPGRRPLPLALPRAGPRRAPGSAAKARRRCAGPLSHAPGAVPGLAGASPVAGLPGLPDPSLPAGLGRRVARAGASGGGCPARGPRSWTPRPRDPRRRRRRGGGENAGGDAREVAAERVLRSVHLRAPRLSGKYRGRLLRPRSRPAAYRPPAAAMTPRPRASATVSAARRRRGRRRLRLPSDVTAWAHSPFPARGCGGGGAHARPFRRRASAGRGRGVAGAGMGVVGRGGAGPGGGVRTSGEAAALGRGRSRRVWDQRCPPRSRGAPGGGRSRLCTAALGQPAVGVGSARRTPRVRPELLRHPGSLGTQLLGNLVASRCVARPGDLRLSLLPGGALVKERK